MTIERGVLRGFDGATYTATVALAASLNTWLTTVPVSRNIAAGDLVSGRNVALAFFDPANPSDAVIFAVWS